MKNETKLYWDFLKHVFRNGGILMALVGLALLLKAYWGVEAAVWIMIAVVAILVVSANHTMKARKDD